MVVVVQAARRPSGRELVTVPFSTPELAPLKFGGAADPERTTAAPGMTSAGGASPTTPPATATTTIARPPGPPTPRLTWT